MRRIGGVALTVTGFLACPCHLIITLPLLISLLAGTALGSFLSRNTGLVTTFAGIYFVVALADGEPGSCSARNARTVRGMQPVPLARRSHLIRTCRSSPHCLWTCLHQAERSYDDLTTRTL